MRAWAACSKWNKSTPLWRASLKLEAGAIDFDSRWVDTNNDGMNDFKVFKVRECEKFGGVSSGVGMQHHVANNTSQFLLILGSFGLLLLLASRNWSLYIEPIHV